MTLVGQPERATQNRVVTLFHGELGYRYLGDWTERPGNSNIEEDLLSDWLTGRGYTKAQINGALYKLRAEANNTGRTLYGNNEAVYDLLRYGVKVKTEAGKATETVHLIDWRKPERNDFAVAEEVTLRGNHERRPDIVLYVNGIAVGVLELKNSRVSISEGSTRRLLPYVLRLPVRPTLDRLDDLAVLGQPAEGDLHPALVEAPLEARMAAQETPQLGRDRLGAEALLRSPPLDDLQDEGRQTEPPEPQQPQHLGARRRRRRGLRIARYLLLHRPLERLVTPHDQLQLRLQLRPPVAVEPLALRVHGRLAPQSGDVLLEVAQHLGQRQGFLHDRPPEACGSLCRPPVYVADRGFAAKMRFESPGKGRNLGDLARYHLIFGVGSTRSGERLPEPGKGSDNSGEGIEEPGRKLTEPGEELSELVSELVEPGKGSDNLGEKLEKSGKELMELVLGLLEPGKGSDSLVEELEMYG